MSHRLPGDANPFQFHDEAQGEHREPFVLDNGTSKSLYFTLDQLQSRMCSANPTQLEVDYTRTMMGFLLFDCQPAHIGMIGLGGGSLLKFCYRYLPETRFTVIEINPHVMALSQQFGIPEDKERITLICADGAKFVRETPLRFDVLLVDGFDHQGQPPSLCSRRFYQHCFEVLTPQGLLVANLHHDHPGHSVFTARMSDTFDGNLVEVASKAKSNSIVFARKGQRISIDELRQADPLAHFEPEVRAQLRGEFARIGWVLTEPG